MFRSLCTTFVLGLMICAFSPSLFASEAHSHDPAYFHPTPQSPAVPVGRTTPQPTTLETSHYYLEQAKSMKDANHDLAYKLATSAADNFASHLRREFDNFIRSGTYDYSWSQMLFNEYDRFSEEAQQLPFLWQASQVRIINKTLEKMTIDALSQEQNLAPEQVEALKHLEASLRKMDKAMFWGSCEELLR